MTIRNAGLWYWLGRNAVKGYLKTFHRLKVVGMENIPPTGGAIIACNHISHLDPPSVGSAANRRLHFVAKEELFRVPFIGWYLTIIGIIPIKRGSGGHAALDKAVEAIEKGQVIAMFPEGTRSKTGYPNKPHTGIIVLAARTGAPIIPARISGSFDCMPPGKFIPRPGPVEVIFGTPVIWSGDDVDLNDRPQMQARAFELMDIIMALPGWFPKNSKPPEKKTEINKDNP
jgi:1-acyl-sn-glycerol-3-phosphate acyltransferase